MTDDHGARSVRNAPTVDVDGRATIRAGTRVRQARFADSVFVGPAAAVVTRNVPDFARMAEFPPGVRGRVGRAGRGSRWSSRTMAGTCARAPEPGTARVRGSSPS